MTPENNIGDGSNYQQPVYQTAANIMAKTMVISASISFIQQPFLCALTEIQKNGGGFRLSLFKGVSNGLLKNLWGGQIRGGVAITSKNAKKIEEEEVGALRVLRNPVLSTFLFGQADLVLSQGFVNSAKLAMAGVTSKATPMKWSVANVYKLMSVNHGSRSISGFVNFASIGFFGSKIISLYNFQNQTVNQFLGGMTAGVFACMITGPLNNYADHKVMASTVDKTGRLLTQSPLTLFSQFKQSAIKEGVGSTLKRLAWKNAIQTAWRAPSTALTFGLIHVLFNQVPENLVFSKPVIIDDSDSYLPKGP